MPVETCSRGHALNEINKYTNKLGYSSCKRCRSLKANEARDRERARDARNRELIAIEGRKFGTIDPTNSRQGGRR